MKELSKLKLNGIAEAGVILASLAFLVFVGSLLYQRSKTQHLTLAAGSRDGESFILCAALGAVVERHFPQIEITVAETGGTVENLKMLEDGRAALAAAQADVLAGPSARILAVLYDDTFQLLTRNEAAGASPAGFPGLRGKIVALPKSGGQFDSFLRVAGHFGLGENDFQYVGATDAEADRAFAEGRADAVFRVRALGNPSLRKLIETGRARLTPIDHAAAMKLSHPAFEPTVIPAGAYRGNPAEPAQDLPSISVQRTLLAAAGLDNETARDITAALIDDRQEIAREIPEKLAEMRLLLAQARRPDARAQLGPALHPGALEYYEKDKPSFILAHSDYIGLMLTVLVMVSSWIWQVKAWLERKQKTVADGYSNRVVALIDTAREAQSQADLEQIRTELLGILTAAVADLDSDKLSEESFHSFRAILQIGLEVVRDCRVTLGASPGGLPVGAA